MEHPSEEALPGSSSGVASKPSGRLGRRDTLHPASPHSKGLHSRSASVLGTRANCVPFSHSHCEAAERSAWSSLPKRPGDTYRLGGSPQPAPGRSRRSQTPAGQSRLSASAAPGPKPARPPRSLARNATGRRCQTRSKPRRPDPLTRLSAPSSRLFSWLRKGPHSPALTHRPHTRTWAAGT